MADERERLGVGEKHWPWHDLTVRWEVYDILFEFQARIGCRQPDGSIMYDYFDERGVQQWTEDFAKAERYVDGSIKWDGCAHLNFGDGADNPGYLHLCGATDFRKLSFVLTEMFLMASTTMPKFDADVADLSRLTALEPR